ncbi:MAG: TraR/DksA family transcriptional regulator [Candidatus Solibacter sp.]
MNNTGLDQLESALQAKLSTIAERPDKRGDIAIQQSADALDQTQLAAERDLVVTLLNRDTQMHRRLKTALLRMEDGTYGTCLACEEPISVKRLRAVPWAELCLSCQERSDLAAAGVVGDDSARGVELRIGSR